MDDNATIEMQTHPAHIDPNLIVDFDYYTDHRFAQEDDLHAGLRRLQREAPPLFWTPAHGGHWVAQGHALTFEAARNTELFSSSKMGIPATPYEDMIDPVIPLNIDPPRHEHYRRPLNAVFSPPAMVVLEKTIRALAADLVDEVVGQGECDFVPTLAEPLPVLTFMRLMGMDLSRLREFRDITHRALVSLDPDVRRGASMEVFPIMAEVIESQRQRLADGHDDDNLVTQLMRMEIDGEPISQKDLEGYARLLFFAGLDTVANAAGFGMLMLARNQALQERLRANPADIPRAVEELLRAGSPVSPARFITRDAEFGGVQVKAGERLLLLLPAANQDEKNFVDPGQIDIDRTTINHLAFNAGPHRCVGAHLARIELKIIYEEWLARIPSFTLKPGHREVVHAGIVLGVDSLPLVWTPKAQA